MSVRNVHDPKILLLSILIKLFDKFFFNHQNWDEMITTVTLDTCDYKDQNPGRHGKDKYKKAMNKQSNKSLQVGLLLASGKR